MTRYVFHYDLEHPDFCLRAAPRLAELHRKYEMPGTIFMVGKVLEARGPDLKKIFGTDPLFDIASHTYSHKLLQDSKMHGPGVDLNVLRSEISDGIRLVEDIFDRPCIGVRSGYGFYRGFRGEQERLQVISECGVRFLSSDLRGPHDSIPAGLVQAYWYDEEGFPSLLELPGHGWHDNVLKGFTSHLALAWPPTVRWGIPNRIPRTPEEEFEVQKVWIDKAVGLGVDYISPVYHPHSIYKMNEDCWTIELIMKYLKEKGIQTATYSSLYERYSSGNQSVPGKDAWTWESDLEDERASLRVGVN